MEKLNTYYCGLVEEPEELEEVKASSYSDAAKKWFSDTQRDVWYNGDEENILVSGDKGKRVVTINVRVTVEFNVGFEEEYKE